MGADSRYTIVGIMRDFHESSFRERIGPIVFRSRDDGNFFHVALMSQNGDVMRWQSTIRKIEKVFLSVYPEEEFNYAFFDDTITKFYAAEQRMSRLLNWSMGLSILISCLGLLGLVMYTAETRTKEIGIRKILGATASDLISILSVEFIRLVVIAFFIAVPLAWWSMHQWLEGFAYRTSMSWWVFVVSGLLLMTIAMITISIQTFKAATADPVKNIRAE